MSSTRRAVVANFGEDLNSSNALSDEPVWAEYYRRLFPDLAAMVKLEGDSPMQRHGVDRILHFPSGLQLTIDEKKRRTAFEDILLELYSDLRRKTPGWTTDDGKICDYVAYAIPKLGKCFFLPYPLLRAAFKLHWQQWSEDFKRKDPSKGGFIDKPNSYNGRSWVTRNVPAPWGILKRAICQQMHRKYSGELVLPVPQVVPAETDEYQLTLAFRVAAVTPAKGEPA